MRAVTATLAICCLGSGLLGCGKSAENEAPPTPDAFAQRIKDNPHMTQAQKDAAMEKIQGTREATGKRAAAKADTGKTADKQP